MRHILSTLILLFATISYATAQEAKPQEQKPATQTTVEGEKPKTEIDRMLEEAEKRGEKILGTCLNQDCIQDPVASGVENGKALHLAKPAYPAIARAAHAQGQVNVQVIIDEEGKVIAAAAISGHPLLFGVSVAAARDTLFTPTLLYGNPVKVVGVIQYNFVTQ
jgi:outer membrane biosynthesis protein TonB